ARRERRPGLSRGSAGPAGSHRGAPGARVSGRSIRRSGRSAHPADRRMRRRAWRQHPRRPHLGAEPGEPVPASHRQEPARMNRKTFLAMLLRDAHVARRNFVPLLLQTLLQPMLFVFIFGRVMTGSGMMPPDYKSLLLPGIIAISMVLSGIQAVALPLVSEFQFQ